MRVFLVGMHRSGTSALARVLNLMGLYLGRDDEMMPPKPDNPAGFWERVDVHQLNEEFFAARGTAWHTAAVEEVDRLPARARRRFLSRARAIVNQLDAHRPWLIKDPRLCLLLPLWRSVVEDPIAVLIVRRPLQVAQSLETRNGLPLPVGVALWEEHTGAALRHTADMPRVIVTHHELMARPLEVAGRLFEWLRDRGLDGIRPAPREAVEGFIRAELFRARGDEEMEAPYLNSQRRRLLLSLLDGSALSTPPPELSADAHDTLVAHRRASATEEELRRTRDQRDALEAARDAARAELARVVAERDALFDEKNAVLEHSRLIAAERDAIFAAKSALLEEIKQLAAERDALFAEKNEVLERSSALATERDALFAEKNALLEKLDIAATARDRFAVDCRSWQAAHDRVASERDCLGRELSAQTDSLSALAGSRDYRLGRILLAPGRALLRLIRRRRA